MNQSLLHILCNYCSNSDICQPNNFASANSSCSIQSSFVNSIISNFTCLTNALNQQDDKLNNTKIKISPTPLEVYGIGLTMVTIINGCACLGIIFIPFMRRRFYKLVLTFMVALAVGSLAGSALLVLLPEALGLKILSEEKESYKNYVWKCTAGLLGIYGFFLLERLLKLMIERHSCTRGSGGGGGQFPLASVNLHREIRDDPIPQEMRIPPPGRFRSLSCSRSNGDEDVPVEMQNQQHQPKENKETILFGHSHHKPDIAPVAWMIVMGDGVHNFVDGLSIGAQFSQSVYLGITVSLAVMCEELPHELGDFAVLLNSGMSTRMALCANGVSALSCYLGFIVGALLGELADVASWIMAMSAGMFLYISLVDMMPEIIHMFESDEGHQLGRWRVFIIQNLGLLTGYSFLLLITLYNPSNFI